MIVRPERAEDVDELAALIDAAFGDTETSEFTARIRASPVVRAAIDAAEQRGEPVVLVEGVPSYYPRFGFRSASELGFERPDPRIPEAAWMALPLSAWDSAVAAPVVYPTFFPPPPNA